jgi:hypothetical protein
VKKNIIKIDKYGISGYNANVPNDDFYAGDIEHRAKFSNGEIVSLKYKPSIKPYRIKGEMSNYKKRPYEDFKANGYMVAAKKRGNVKRGFFYENVVEDTGSISAVVPSLKHLEEIKI